MNNSESLTTEQPSTPYQPNCGGLHIRKWYHFEEQTLANESGVLTLGEPLSKIVIAAAIRNPYANTFSEDLSEFIRESKELGDQFAVHLASTVDTVKIESYGKACLVGAQGEYEHGNALLTTEFANPLRDAIGDAKSWLPSTGKIGSPGTSIDVPLAHKGALYVRSHYDTVTIAFGDAPRIDEIVIIFACATRGRLHARLGGLDASSVKGEDGLC
jgi:hypothetical protein